VSEAQVWLVDWLRERHPCSIVLSEYRFLPDRQFRFDVAVMGEKLAFEIEGGTWVRGRHTRGVGYQRDMEKYNLATAAGWKVYRFTPQQILSGDAAKFIKEYL
jgi:very-short-patch-repair endonuclease